MLQKNIRKIVFVGLAIAVLSGGFFVLRTLVVKNGSSNVVVKPSRMVLTDADYRIAVLAAFSSFKKDDLVSVKAIRDHLLELVVPAEEKETHFALVTKLTSYSEALKSGKGSDKIYNKLIALADKNEWLKAVRPF